MRWFVACLLLSGSWAPPAAADGFPWKKHAKQPDAWFKSDEAKEIAANVLSHQAPEGGWPKNLDTGARPYRGDARDLHGTFDNGATTGELRFLARMFKACETAAYRTAFDKGLAHILKAQYPTGGWPQFYPPDDKYHRHITFNDDAMVLLLQLLRDVAEGDDFAFVAKADREAAAKAFGRGIDCIVKCQIVVEGKRTAWCAQHDEKTLEPRKGRTYEHESISGGESSGILLLLMSLDKPSPEVVRAVHAGARWYESAQLTGIRVAVKGGDRVVEKDAKAPPLWARFYEIKTNRPIFSGRDGVVKYDLSEIEKERRNGYSWYGGWGSRVRERYAQWKEKHPEEKD